VYAVKGHGMPGLRETMKPKFYTSASCYVIQTLTLVTLCLIERRVAWIFYSQRKLAHCFEVHRLSSVDFAGAVRSFCY